MLSAPDRSVGVMNREQDRFDQRLFGVELFDQWTAMWNGDLALAARIMASSFTLRYAQAGTEAFDRVADPAALAAVIQAWHRHRPGICFRAEGDAVVDLALINGQPVGRVARPYLAKFVDAAGQTVARSGIDILAVHDARITQVWSVSSGAAGRTFYADALPQRSDS
jgi:hypothetical protein